MIMSRIGFVLGLSLVVGCGGAGTTQRINMEFMTPVSLNVEDASRRVSSACESVFLAFEGPGSIRLASGAETPLHAGHVVLVGKAPVTLSLASGSIYALTVSHPCGAEPPDAPQIADAQTTPELSAMNGKMRVRILFDASNGSPGAAFSVIDADPDLAVPEHVHETSMEILTFKSGGGVLHVAQMPPRPIAQVHFVPIPAGRAHSFQGDGSAPIQGFQVYTPAGPEQRFRAAQ